MTSGPMICVVVAPGGTEEAHGAGEGAQESPGTGAGGGADDAAQEPAERWLCSGGGQGTRDQQPASEGTDEGQWRGAAHWRRRWCGVQGQ